MEEDLIDLYLEQVRKYLEILPERRRERALGEIGLQLSTSRSIGRSAEDAIERLGPPEAVAAQYIERYGEATSHASRGAGGAIRRRVAVGAWAAGWIMVPALGLVALVLALAALVVPMFGVLHMFSPGWLVFGYADWEVPQEWSMPVAVAAGLVLGGIAWAIYAGLRAYVRWAALGYEQHVAAQEPQAVRVTARDV
jgi:uncharacterized membrane protein